MEKLPKASQNLTYTMEKFVNQPIVGSSVRDEEFDRDSNMQDIDALMNDQPRMQSPPRFTPSNAQDQSLAPLQSESPRGMEVNLRTEPDLDAQTVVPSNRTKTADSRSQINDNNSAEQKKAEFTFKMPTKLLGSTIGKSDTQSS